MVRPQEIIYHERNDGISRPAVDLSMAEVYHNDPEFSELLAVPESDVDEVLISLAASNPLDVPLISSPIMRRSPVLTKVLLEGEKHQTLKDLVRTNPLLDVLYNKLKELNETGQKHRIASGHEQLEENIRVVENVTLWQILNGSYDENLGSLAEGDKVFSPLTSWSVLSTRMSRVLSQKIADR